MVALCAAWCDTCGQFRGAFQRIATEHRSAKFIWLDIEDDAQVVGEVDVENFPTLAIYQDGRLVHFGVSLPQEGLVRRLVESFVAEPRAELREPEAAVTLPARIAHAGR